MTKAVVLARIASGDFFSLSMSFYILLLGPLVYACRMCNVSLDLQTIIAMPALLIMEASPECDAFLEPLLDYTSADSFPHVSIHWLVHYRPLLRRQR